MDKGFVNKIMNTPFSVFEKGPIDAFEDATYVEAWSGMCYYATDSAFIVNPASKHELSGGQLYMKGEDLAKVRLSDLISIPTEGVDKVRILKIETFRRFTPSIETGVVYLP
jgi:hypothetical protein